MKITSVELHPEGSSDICVLSFRDPRRMNSFNVKGIQGLDAEDIIPRYYGGSGSTKYYNLSLEERVLVLRIELNPIFKLGEVFSTLRDKIYRMIASSRTGVVQVQFKNGNDVVASISGFVSKLEAPHFEKSQEVQITIECSDPMLRALSPVEVDVTGLTPTLTVIQDSLSTAPHGLYFEMLVTAPIPSFSIGDSPWSFVVTPVGGFLANDVIHFSSKHDDKYVYVTRGSNDIHMADVIQPASIWPILFPGPNTFVCQNGASLAWQQISHYPTYWGV